MSGLLTGRTYAVTGASKGFGLAISKALLAGGANVGMTARDDDVLQSVVAELGADRVTGIAGDVADDTRMAAAFEQIKDRFGSFNGLINNAGLTRPNSHCNERRKKDDPMPSITYIEADGTRHEVAVEEQLSLMEGAILNLVPGVEGICGGLASCATCHCYIEGEMAEKLPRPQPDELAMLNTAKFRKPSSRLGCQISVSWEMDGMEVHLPEEQGSHPLEE